MTARRRDLPRDVEAIARLLLPAAARDVVLGDLAEDARRRRLSALRLRWELLRSAAAMLVRRRRAPSRSLIQTSAWPTVGPDLRQALRALIQRPGFTVMVALSLALGIAGSVLAFETFEAALLRRSPFADPDRLVRIWQESPAARGDLEISYAFFDALPQSGALEQAAAVWRVRMVVPGEQGADRLRGEAVTAAYFDMLGVVPDLGRLPAPSAYAGDSNEIVISHAYWVNRLGSDPDVIGTTILSRNRVYEVVGVMPPEFVGTTEEDVIDFWAPLLPWLAGEAGLPRSALLDPERRWMRVVGRLQEDVDERAAALALAATTADFALDDDPTTTVRVESLGARWKRAVRPGILLFGAGAACLLLIACVNVANLATARLLERGNELATRRALGGSPWAIARTVLVENLVLAGLGATGGLLLASVAVHRLPDLVFRGLADYVQVPGYVTVGIGAGSVLQAVMVTVGAAACITTVPLAVVWGSTRSYEGAGRGAADLRGVRLTTLVSVAEVGLATVLLAGAGLLLRSWVALEAADVGFRTAGVLKVQVTANPPDYEAPETRRAYLAAMLEAARTSPGVESAAMAAPTLPFLSIAGVAVSATGAAPAAELPAQLHLVSDGFFDVLGIPLLAGEPVGSVADPSTPEQVVVSRTLAERLTGGSPEALLGRGLTLRSGPANHEVAVVGVAGDVSYEGPTGETGPLDVYLPLSVAPPTFFGIAVRVAAPGHIPDVVSELRTRLAALDPSSALHWIETMDQSLQDQGVRLEGNGVLLGVLSALGLIMAALGIYGVITFSMSRREGEVAVRMALGATPEEIRRLVLRRAFAVVSAGLAVGAVGAVLFGRLLEGSLYGVDATDPATLGATALVLASIGMLSALTPALRATRIDPGVALRQ